MTKFKLLVSIATLLIITAKIFGQSKGHISVNKEFPNYFFNEIHYYQKKQASINDFKGKWLVLDFWGEYCKGCIASFPKVNTLQKELSAEIQIVLVGVIYKDKKQIVALYEKCREEANLDLPIVYDSILSKKINSRYFPDVVVIDPKGVVRSRTPYLTREGLEAIIKGKENPEYIDQDELSNNQDSYKYNIPFQLNNNGSDADKYLFRSVLANYNARTPNAMVDEDGRLEILKADLETLYKLAYIGTASVLDIELNYKDTSPQAILEIKDSSLFKHSDILENNYFSYSFSYPKTGNKKHVSLSKSDFLKSVLQNDLRNYFPFKAQMERRNLHCYTLKATKKARKNIKTNGIKSNLENSDHVRVQELGNTKTEYLIHAIYQSPGYPYNYLIIDKTKIDYRFNASINAIYFSEWKKILKQNGLSLVKTRRKISTLVVRDKK